MSARDAAIASAAACIAEGYELLDTLPVDEAARRAYTPTGPSLTELEARIRARRAHQTPAPGAAPRRRERRKTA